MPGSVTTIPVTCPALSIMAVPTASTPTDFPSLSNVTVGAVVYFEPGLEIVTVDIPSVGPPIRVTS